MTVEAGKFPRISRDQFLAIDDKRPAEFHSERWGCTMVYRPATVGDKAAARRGAVSADGKDEKIDYDRFAALLIQRCLVEPRLELHDVDALMEKNSAECERLFGAISGSVSGNPR